MKRSSSEGSKQKGMALLIAIFTLVLLSVIGLGLMYSTNMETIINGNYRGKQLAMYGALSGVQEARDRLLLVEPAPGGEIEDVDAAERAVLAVPDQRFDCVAHRGVRGTAEGTEQRLNLGLGLGIVHDAKASPKKSGRQWATRRNPAKERERTVKSAVPR